jgi:hypothetical protein
MENDTGPTQFYAKIRIQESTAAVRATHHRCSAKCRTKKQPNSESMKGNEEGSKYLRTRRAADRDLKEPPKKAEGVAS